MYPSMKRLQSVFLISYTPYSVWRMCISLFVLLTISCNGIKINQIEDGFIHIQSVVLHKNILFDSYTEYDAEIHLQIRMEKSGFISFESLQWGGKQLPLYVQHPQGFISVAHVQTYIPQDSIVNLKAFFAGFKPEFIVTQQNTKLKEGDEIKEETQEIITEKIPETVLIYRNRKGRIKRVGVKEPSEIKNFFK